MAEPELTPRWTRRGTIVTIESRWVRLLAERWLNEHGAPLEYWRVERAHSLIVLPIWRKHLLLPRPQFRPGVNRPTLDFPGGRLPDGMAPVAAAAELLHSELGIDHDSVVEVRPLNQRGWIVNSSFSNQLVYGVVAMLDPAAAVDAARLHAAVPWSAAALDALADELECLQCRAVLQEWRIQTFAGGAGP